MTLSNSRVLDAISHTCRNGLHLKVDVGSLTLSPHLDPLDCRQNFGCDAGTLILGAHRFVVSCGWRPAVRKIAEGYFDGDELIGGCNSEVRRFPATTGQRNRAAAFACISRVAGPGRKREPVSPVRFSGAGYKNQRAADCCRCVRERSIGARFEKPR